MAVSKKRHFSILAFILLVLLSTGGLYVFYGYLIRGRTYINVAIPVAKVTKHESTSHRLSSRSTTAEMCQLPEVKQYTASMIHGSTSKNRYHLFRNTKVCYCIVPKAASTSLLRSLLIAEYPEKTRYYTTLAGSDIHAQREIRQSRSTSRACSTGSEMSFFVTRDPYQRLFSAYIDKIFLEKFPGIAQNISRSKSYNDKEGKIASTKIHSPTNISRQCDVTVATFEQFLNRLITLHKLDPHFAPITSICNPCEHHFDLVLKQEKLDEQKHDLLKYLKQDGMSSKGVPLSDYSGMDGIQRTAATFYSLMKTRCELGTDRADSINRRFWDALKILGNIDDRLEFNQSWFSMSWQKYTGEGIGNSLVKNLRENGIEALDPVQREQQRQKHLIQAYRNVNTRTIQQIQRLYKMDFTIFGYDDKPPR